MNAPPSRAPSARQVLLVGGAGALVVLVVVAVYVQVRDLAGQVGGGTPVPTQAESTAVAPGVLPTVPGAAVGLVRHEDEQSGVSFERLAAWKPLQTQPETTAEAGRSVVFEHPTTGARLAVTVWTGRGTSVPSRDRVAELAPGMDSVDGRWPTNALVAGEPAIVVWSDEGPDQPARYAAFLTHCGDLYRVSYSARDGGVMVGEFARTLVGLEWSDEPTTDVVPLLPRPAGVFYPPLDQPAEESGPGEDTAEDGGSG